MGTASSIAIVGVGRFGTALAKSLAAAGYRITELVPRSPRSAHVRALARRLRARVASSREPVAAQVIWLAVPDREITACATALAKTSTLWEGKTVLHSSGALTSDALAPLREQGAHGASAHPLMTFVHGTVSSLDGVSFALEGDPAAVRTARAIIKKLGGRTYTIRHAHKAAYHAWGTFASPLLTILFAVAEQVAASANVPPAEARRRMIPILRQTVENYARHGAAKGFSGPIVRGDAETVRKHLAALRGVSGAADVYRALARAALEILPVENRKALRAVLNGVRAR
jgi:predicted short-subunit dehydrogenase-like oxidoreductase (DUF2520 family)